MKGNEGQRRQKVSNISNVVINNPTPMSDTNVLKRKSGISRAPEEGMPRSETLAISFRDLHPVFSCYAVSPTSFSLTLHPDPLPGTDLFIYLLPLPVLSPLDTRSLCSYSSKPSHQFSPINGMATLLFVTSLSWQ